MSNHHCHATGCYSWCAPEKLMCLNHWKLVPTKLQIAVYKTYRKGQCSDFAVGAKMPSKEWVKAAAAAIEYVAKLEGKTT